MSHFSCIVVTPSKPSEKELGAILQPWHEYECTGVRDQYVVEVDMTDEVLEQFNKPQEVVVLPAYLHPDPVTGELVLGVSRVYSRYDNRFYTKEPEIKGSSLLDRGRKEFELPPGASIETMSAEEARKHGIGYATMAECAEEYFGADIEGDGKFFRLTNPNKKWDWWQVGGRWTGMLIPNYRPEEDPRNIKTCELCNGTGKRTDSIALEQNPGMTEVTCNGCGGKGQRAEWPTNWVKVAGDQMRLDEIPLITLRDEAERKALQRYDQAIEIIAGREIPIWEKVVEKHFKDYKQAREEFNDNQVIKDLREAKILDFFDGDTTEFTMPRERVASIHRASAICPFAYVYNGEWNERGEMGWWACVSGEKDRATWAEQFSDMLDKLPGDYYLSVIDCHI